MSADIEENDVRFPPEDDTRQIDSIATTFHWSGGEAGGKIGGIRRHKPSDWDYWLERRRRRQSETPNPGYVLATTPGWEFGFGYVEGQTPAPVGRASRTPTLASPDSHNFLTPGSLTYGLSVLPCLFFDHCVVGWMRLSSQ